MLARTVKSIVTIAAIGVLTGGVALAQRGPGGGYGPGPGRVSPDNEYAKNSVLENMQIAYNGESNAHNKYLKFAEKADKEGYKGVASLFRAAAAAEKIHAENHAEVIKALGAEPKATIEEVKVGMTKDNLEAAIEGESFERDTMYPGMMAAARGTRNRQAMRSLNFALYAETGHAVLYQQALADLDSWTTVRTFYVCGVCGNTVEKLGFKKCPSCFIKVDEYFKVT